MIILLMEEILYQLIGSSSRYLQGSLHPSWCRIYSFINNSTNSDDYDDDDGHDDDDHDDDDDDGDDDDDDDNDHDSNHYLQDLIHNIQSSDDYLFRIPRQLPSLKLT